MGKMDGDNRKGSLNLEWLDDIKEWWKRKKYISYEQNSPRTKQMETGGKMFVGHLRAFCPWIMSWWWWFRTYLKTANLQSGRTYLFKELIEVVRHRRSVHFNVNILVYCVPHRQSTADTWQSIAFKRRRFICVVFRLWRNNLHHVDWTL